MKELSLLNTQKAIKDCKDMFIGALSQELDLSRVSAPLFVSKDSGFNDNLNGVERPVTFDIKESGVVAEVVHSLAKWKRFALKKYGFEMHKGLYTDMNAIRRDEIVDNIHSIYVDQWDWEKVISAEDRTIDYLKSTVRGIYKVIRNTCKEVRAKYGLGDCDMAEDIAFVTTQQLEDEYPDMTPQQRENGLELSSMGIRVDRESLLSQLKSENALDRLELPFHKALADGQLPLSIGGGIGQSRLCMFILGKRHIGEVQPSIWSQRELDECEAKGIKLL